MKNFEPIISRTLILICPILLFSCTGEKIAEKECNLSMIKGQWAWKETIIEISGAHLTPDNTGWNERLVITDSVWSEFNNDSLIFSSIYKFTPDTNSIYIKGVVNFSEPPGKFIRIYNCTMTIEGGFNDSPIITYEYVE